MTHYHPYEDDYSSAPPAYCSEHMPTGEAVALCDLDHACVRCEEEHEPQVNLDAWFEHIATCKGC